MLTLFSYPELYGLADNNPYGLKVYAFLRLCGLEFRQEHIFDAKAAPRGQLPYVVDDSETIGDSNEIVDHLIAKYRLPIDVDLSPAQHTTDHLLRRMLDDLYWVMSYSRWHDPRYWPTFRAEILRTHAQVTEADLLTLAAWEPTFHGTMARIRELYHGQNGLHATYEDCPRLNYPQSPIRLLGAALESMESYEKSGFGRTREHR